MLRRLALLALVLPATVSTMPQAQPRVRAVETALDRYVAAPDASFSWKVAGQLPATGVTATLLEMTSQRWLSEREVERPLWTHWIVVTRPAVIKSDIAMLFISGGRLDRQPPAAPTPWLAQVARDTGSVVAELRLVPNQPIVFTEDPAHKPRLEDDFIAYTWNKFLRTGDDRWPARLPMTKSAVRAMDAVTAFAASPEGGAARVDRFVVSGASKRGWTTWTTAAVDPRVVGAIPAVIDVLNVVPSFFHHWRAYGAWADAVADYREQGILDWLGSREFAALMRIEDPYEYRARLTMPKLMVNASGDQFFLPDSSSFYFDALPGEKYLRYVPNTSHGLEKSDALETVQAFYSTIVTGTPRPGLQWSFEKDGSIQVRAKDRPDAVRMWQAVNPKARDFRVDTIGPTYKSTALLPTGPNTWTARVEPPAEGWTAFYVEMDFPSGGTHPLKLTTAVRVLPDTLPHPAPTLASGTR